MDTSIEVNPPSSSYVKHVEDPNPFLGFLPETGKSKGEVLLAKVIIEVREVVGL